ncbi:MAG: hypothetical protein IIC64_13390 [SAR324 cluster bacterium]|nr:hypothetical protein [SAR324 cluster bacterium]
MGWNTKYPIGRLVAKRARELGISRTEIVKRLGYTNPSKGLRRLDGHLATGQQTTHLLKRLPDVLGLETAQVEAAAAETRQQIAGREEAVAREQFRPNILGQTTSGVRMPFFVQAFAYGEKVLGLPEDFESLSASRQVKKAIHIVRLHYRKKGGDMGTWGKITGYRLQRTFDHAVVLNVDGTIRDGFDRDPEPPPPMLTIKGKRVPVGLFGEG